MRLFDALVVGLVAAFVPSGWRNLAAQTGPEQASGGIAGRDEAAALAEAEQTLARSPGDPNALFQSARIHFQLGHDDVARDLAEQLVKAAGNAAAAWELMTQIAQAQGDLKRRDEAIVRLKSAIGASADPATRGSIAFFRERIRVGAMAVTAADYFGRGGSDFIRYQFSLYDPRLFPETGLLLRTDAATTEAWSATALLPPDRPLFHLDAVEVKPDGKPLLGTYEYYVGEPDYDTVRAKVMQILRGEVLPLSGEPGSLAGLLKQGQQRP